MMQHAATNDRVDATVRKFGILCIRLQTGVVLHYFLVCIRSCIIHADRADIDATANSTPALAARITTVSTGIVQSWS